MERQEVLRGKLPGKDPSKLEPPLQVQRASVTHKGVTVVLLTLTLELLLKDGDCSGRLIENGPDFSRSPWLTTVPKVS